MFKNESFYFDDYEAYSFYLFHQLDFSYAFLRFVCSQVPLESWSPNILQIYPLFGTLHSESIQSILKL